MKRFETEYAVVEKFGEFKEGRPNAPTEDYFLLTQTRARVVHFSFYEPEEPPDDEEDRPAVIVWAGPTDGDDILANWDPERGWDVRRQSLSKIECDALEPRARALWEEEA